MKSCPQPDQDMQSRFGLKPGKSPGVNSRYGCFAILLIGAFSLVILYLLDWVTTPAISDPLASHVCFTPLALESLPGSIDGLAGETLTLFQFYARTLVGLSLGVFILFGASLILRFKSKKGLAYACAGFGLFAGVSVAFIVYILSLNGVAAANARVAELTVAPYAALFISIAGLAFFAQTLLSAASAARALRVREKSDRKEWLWAYLLVAPTIIGLCVLNVYPFFQSIYTSFFRSQGLGTAKFIGYQNYDKMLGNEEIWRVTYNTLRYMAMTVPVGVFISLILASLLNNKIRGRDLYRGIYFLPMVVAPAAGAMVFRWVFNADNGILNYGLHLLGVAGPKWLADPNTALIACAIIGVWGSVGYDLVMLLAGLQSISRTYYEASEIDGASRVQQFFRITMPLVSPTLFFVVLMRMMGSIQQFDTVFMLIRPESPSYKRSVTLMVNFYREAFEKYSKGSASAVVIWSVLIISVITGVQFLAEKRLVHYD